MRVYPAGNTTRTPFCECSSAQPNVTKTAAAPTTPSQPRYDHGKTKVSRHTSLPLTGEPLDVVDVRHGRVRAVRYDLSRRVRVPESPASHESTGGNGNRKEGRLGRGTVELSREKDEPVGVSLIPGWQLQDALFRCSRAPQCLRSKVHDDGRSQAKAAAKIKSYERPGKKYCCCHHGTINPCRYTHIRCLRSLCIIS